MKVTLKFRRQLREAIVSEMCALIDIHCPEVQDNPPEVWDDDTRRRFDLITEVEGAMTKAIDKVLNS